MSDQPPDPGREPADGRVGSGEDGNPPPPGDEGRGPGEELVGTVLAGRYRILRLLGVGAMGSVYLGEHLNFGRKDAIKVLHPAMARDPEATKRFLRGARNVSAINHPNVCTVYDFSDTDDGLQFLAMEFVEGEPLSDTLERDGALPVRRAVPIVEQAAAALQAAHDQEIVHRDLKPGNIMLTRDREGSDLVKVVDFDIAKGSREGEGSEVTRLGFVVGTPEYMSPEQLTGDPLDGRSDIYSLALVLFRLLTGRLPVRATSTQDLLVERLTRDPLTLREVAAAGGFPGGVQRVLDRALQRRREDRHSTAVEFARDLVDAAGSGTAEGGSPAEAAGAAGGRATVEQLAPGRRASPVDAGAGTAEGADLPATRISDPGRTPSPPAATARDGADRRRRLLAWGLGTVAVLAVSWGGWVALAGGSDAPTSQAGAAGERPDASVAAGDETGAVGVEGDDPRAGAGRTGDAGDTADAGGPGAAGETGETEGAGDPTAGEDVEVGAGPPFPPSTAEDVVFRQVEGLLAGRASPSFLQAAADTAGMVMDMAGASTAARAVAAYVLGDVSATRGDTTAAISWLERSLEIDPDQQAPRTLLGALRGGGRP